ncbi:MAG: hypothetical protein AAB916_00735 [Patescibacteria group bacterium]
MENVLPKLRTSLFLLGGNLPDRDSVGEEFIEEYHDLVGKIEEQACWPADQGRRIPDHVMRPTSSITGPATWVRSEGSGLPRPTGRRTITSQHRICDRAFLKMKIDKLINEIDSIGSVPFNMRQN